MSATNVFTWWTGSIETHRTIIDAGNQHVSLENAVLDLVCSIALPYLLVEICV